MFDIRCLALTVQRNTAAVPTAVKLHHTGKCICNIPEPNPTVVTVLGRDTDWCPCGLKKHQGMCADAAVVARGGKARRWQP